MDLTQLLVGDEKKYEIDKVLRGQVDPLWFASVRNWRDRTYNPYNKKEDWELKIHAIDAIMDTFGVETLIDGDKAIASYVNTGDTYTPTVLYDHENEEFLVTSWDDFYEQWQSENIININCKDVAQYIYNVSHSKYIEWSEWVEGDREEYDSDEDYIADAFIDIRLQVMEDGSWSLPYGSSDFDQDHRGAWGSSSVGKCVSMETAMAIAKELIEQAAESADCCLTKQVRIYNDD